MVDCFITANFSGLEIAATKFEQGSAYFFVFDEALELLLHVTSLGLGAVAGHIGGYHHVGIANILDVHVCSPIEKQGRIVVIHSHRTL